jgi:hypothetical protein
MYIPQLCLFFYSQGPNYNISHTIWIFNTLINKNTPKHEKFQFTKIPALTPISVMNKEWCSNRVRLTVLCYRNTAHMPGDVQKGRCNLMVD